MCASCGCKCGTKADKGCKCNCNKCKAARNKKKK